MTSMDPVVLQPVGRVVGGRDEWFEDGWEAVESVIELDSARFGEGAVTGLAEFSHLEVVFLFDRVDPERISAEPRPPRGDPRWEPVGVFAHRGPYRPNRLGVSRCRLLEVDGPRLRVAGLDALSGTPVLDVKPHIAEFGARGEIRQPAWAGELMDGYHA
ncbi:SAM-dependent methyltransferase [Phytomonospora sp. NPDC050363]|uniref:SAM-dependent methyltransferase n=1 Tax=Phytomonospora sp. NPDC050363 TaxID=3155642 RepID=UPI0033E9B394